MSTTAEQLKVNTSLFLGFTTEDLRILAPAVTRRTLTAGEVLFRRDEPGTSLFIVSEGVLEVRRPIAGTGLPLAKLEVGQACGEIGLIAGRRTADVIAAVDSVVLEMPRDRLDQALEGQPEVAIKLWHNLAVALADRLTATSAMLDRFIEHHRQSIGPT
jgi:CRP-like cAMP-binding protein